MIFIEHWYLPSPDFSKIRILAPFTRLNSSSWLCRLKLLRLWNTNERRWGLVFIFQIVKNKILQTWKLDDLDHYLLGLIVIFDNCRRDRLAGCISISHHSAPPGTWMFERRSVCCRISSLHVMNHATHAWAVTGVRQGFAAICLCSTSCSSFYFFLNAKI